MTLATDLALLEDLSNRLTTHFVNLSLEATRAPLAEWLELRREVGFTPAYLDTQHDYGRHHSHLNFRVRGSRGTVVLDIGTGWYLPDDTEAKPDDGPRAWSLSVHHAVTQEVPGAQECSYTGTGHCISSSTYLANDWLLGLHRQGSAWLWPRLEAYYHHIFHDGPAPDLTSRPGVFVDGKLTWEDSDLAAPATRSIDLPKPTPDQAAYLAEVSTGLTATADLPDVRIGPAYAVSTAAEEAAAHFAETDRSAAPETEAERYAEGAKAFQIAVERACDERMVEQKHRIRELEAEVKRLVAALAPFLALLPHMEGDDDARVMFRQHPDGPQLTVGDFRRLRTDAAPMIVGQPVTLLGIA